MQKRNNGSTSMSVLQMCQCQYYKCVSITNVSASVLQMCQYYKSVSVSMTNLQGSLNAAHAAQEPMEQNEARVIGKLVIYTFVHF